VTTVQLSAATRGTSERFKPVSAGGRQEAGAIPGGFDTKTITLSCGKLTTGITVPQWSSILMLRNLKSPETYFQAAFRVQSPWSIKNPNGDNPNEDEILKPVCFVFDFAPTRALRQLSEYGIGLSPNEPNPENAVKDLVSFLPVLAYDGANIDADRRGRNPRYGDGGHLGHTAGPQVGERAARECGQ
jgi:hypothetical protein